MLDKKETIRQINHLIEYLEVQIFNKDINKLKVLELEKEMSDLIKELSELEAYSKYWLKVIKIEEPHLTNVALFLYVTSTSLKFVVTW